MTCETCGNEPARCGSGSCDRCITKHGEVLEAEYEAREIARKAEAVRLATVAAIEAAKKEDQGEIL